MVMVMHRSRALMICFLIPPTFLLAQVQTPNPLASYISVSDPVIALTHVEIIDGTGAAPAIDQTVVVNHGKIASVAPSSSAHIPAGAKVFDLQGHTTIRAWWACMSIFSMWNRAGRSKG